MKTSSSDNINVILAGCLYQGMNSLPHAIAVNEFLVTKRVSFVVDSHIKRGLKAWDTMIVRDLIHLREIGKKVK
jgi:hypothetical protein